MIPDRAQQTGRMRERLKLETEADILETFLGNVYGDLLSGNRRGLYGSLRPASQYHNTTPSLHRPNPRREASAIRRKTIAPLLDWYSVSDSKASTTEVEQRWSKIAKVLEKHAQDRGAKNCRQKIQGLGSETLYRNVLGAVLEAYIFMLIN